MQIELKGCPFCGCSAEIERVGNSRQSTIYSCDGCGCRLETNEEWGHGTAWNRRAPLTATAESGEGEEVGEAGSMPGSAGFTMAAFRAEDVPIGTKLYVRRARLAAVLRAYTDGVK